MKYIFTIILLSIWVLAYSQALIDSQDKESQSLLNSNLFQDNFIITMQIDYIPTNFDEFESLLGSDIVYEMNKENGTGNFELARIYKGLFLGISFGFALGDYSNDLFDMKFNEFQYSVNTGIEYNLKRLQILPKFGIRLHQYKLKTSPKTDMSNKNNVLQIEEIKMNLNQLYAYQGVSLGYKIPMRDDDFFIIGFYVNYVFKLNSKPYIQYNDMNITSDRNIIIDNVNLGVYFSFSPSIFINQ